jgi:hypothetical protein
MHRIDTTQDKPAGLHPFQPQRSEEPVREPVAPVHIFGKGFVCDTDARGYATPRNRSRTEIVLDASEGFIPLWAKDTTLRWRFQERSMLYFEDPEAAAVEIEQLLGEALLAWGDAMPVKFARRDDAWDFEIVMRASDRCSMHGCVLASAFFPDAGRHVLDLYPRMFEQSREEQVETLIHEIGHVFGLRHFFANLRETEWPSVVFGTHEPFTIMNYGEQSRLTSADRDDLRRLYQKAWSGELTHINGTPIRLVKPYHTIGESVESVVAIGPIPTVCPPQPAATYTNGTPSDGGRRPGLRRRVR